MVARTSYSLVGITDYDEGTNLSRYLIGHGWQTDHAMTPEEVLADLNEGGYELVVLDEEMLSDSEWTLQDYLEEIGSNTAVLVLTEPGSRLRGSLPSGMCDFVEHPYTYENLRLAIDRMVSGRYDEEDYYPLADDTLSIEGRRRLVRKVCSRGVGLARIIRPTTYLQLHQEWSGLCCDERAALCSGGLFMSFSPAAVSAR